MKTEDRQSCTKILKFIYANINIDIEQFTPNGWNKSDLYNVFHPTSKQLLSETKQIHINLQSLNSETKENLDLTDSKNKLTTTEIIPLDEFTKILGLCIWDIFSNNHKVISSNNKLFDFGSFRGTSRFISEFLNIFYPAENNVYSYIDFYFGTSLIRNRADLTPVYNLIFIKLKNYKCRWTYTFPRIYVIKTNNLSNNETAEKSNHAEYNPNKAMKIEIAQNKKENKIQKLKDEFDKCYYDEFENAKYEKPTEIVLAYQSVYGNLPDGHPQKEI